MDILLTALALAALAGCFLAYTRCQRCADDAADDLRRCDELALKLRGELARITALEGGYEQLHSQHRKLAGKFYARDYYDRQHDLDNAPPGITAPQLLTPACENWAAAQLEGPKSKAAACECGYCLAQRAARAREKAAILAARQPLQKPVNGGE